MDDRQFDALMTRVAAAMTYPPTPQLRGHVLIAIREPAAARPRDVVVRRPAFAFAGLASAIALVAAGIALAVPTSRTAIAEFFGIERSKVERLPTPPAGTSATPFPPGSELPPGARPASLEEAASALGFDIALPPDLGEPQSLYVVDYPRESAVILRYPEFDLWEAKPRGTVFAKGVPEGAIVLDLTTPDGRKAYFIEGGPHIVRLVDNDSVIPGSERTVERNTLVFSSGHAFYRIETELPRSDALLRLADSLR